MKKVDFTFKNKKFTLDMIRGELHGEDKTAVAEITAAISALTRAHQYLGAGYLPIPPTTIDRPLQDAAQFALCMMTVYGTDFPEELADLVPQWPQNDSAAGTDYPSPPESLLLCH